MKFFLRSVAMATFAFTGIQALAQAKLEPGKNAFEAKWIASEHYDMKWYAVKDTMKIELATITTTAVKDKKNLTIVTEVKMKNNPAPWIDSTVADVNTMAPVMHSSYNAQRDMGIHFGKVVKGFYNDKIKKTNTPVSDTISAPYFDSNLYPALVRWLPLSEGYTCSIPIYDYRPNKSGMIYAYVKKVESGTFTGKAGKSAVWLVTVHDEISDDANSYSVFSIDKADRRLWQQELVMTGRRMLMVRED